MLSLLPFGSYLVLISSYFFLSFYDWAWNSDKSSWFPFEGGAGIYFLGISLSFLLFFITEGLEGAKVHLLILLPAKHRHCYMLGSLQFSHSNCLTLCDPMDCSTPGFTVHPQLLEPTQTHVHCIGDAIQPSHPLSSPSPPALNLSSSGGQSIGVSASSSVLAMNIQDWFPLGLTGWISLQSKG